MNAKKILDNLSIEDAIGQLLCYDICDQDDMNEVERVLKESRPGSLFLSVKDTTKRKMYMDMANKYSALPVMCAQDLEFGVGEMLDNQVDMPSSMAWGAADDVELVTNVGRITAQEARKNNIQWTFSPVVDININKNNPLINIRAVSDSAKQVAKIAGAFARGMQENGYLVTCAKHFPGDGVDDRNQHFCTSINNLTCEQWDKTFGYVYKKMIENGVSSIMVAHIALPCYDEDGIDPVYGALPACLSYNLITKLLKQQLGFNGCVVSDAMSMIGSASRVPLNKLAISFIKAGGDIVLFPEPTDYLNILNAVNSGELSINRVKDAALRVIEMKIKARMFENQDDVIKEIPLYNNAEQVGRELAEKSIKIVRDVPGNVPLKLKANAKILMINLYKDPFKCVDDDNTQLLTVEEELKSRGYDVTVYHRITHNELNKIKDDYDAILINSKISSRDYNGGSLRFGWTDGIMTFWRAYVLQHPCVIFTSFGDPYKLYELPFLKTYINTFSYSKCTQRAFVKVLLGEIPAVAKNPVELEGYFSREVE